jgi:hypothetical protein
MHFRFLPLLALVSILFFASSCSTGQTAVPVATAAPLTISNLAGLWESEYGFFFFFDAQDNTFTGSRDEQAARDKLGIMGTFELTGDQLSLVENEDSDSCPGQEGLFEAALTRDDKLRLTLVEDPCIYRVEGVFQGGQGGHRLLQFDRVKD